MKNVRCYNRVLGKRLPFAVHQTVQYAAALPLCKKGLDAAVQKLLPDYCSAGNHTLKRTPGISPTACPRRPNPAMRTSSCSVPRKFWHRHDLDKAQDASLTDEHQHNEASHHACDAHAYVCGYQHAEVPHD